MDAERFYRKNAVGGRAVIEWHTKPDTFGTIPPMLWLCRVGGVLVACDDRGPSLSSGLDEGFVEPIATGTSVALVKDMWERYRAAILLRRRQDRQNRRVA
jgi:hypothetical protein